MTLYGHLINSHLLLLYVYELGSLHLFENYPSVNYINSKHQNGVETRLNHKISKRMKLLSCLYIETHLIIIDCMRAICGACTAKSLIATVNVN